ncbi:MAG: hypothetical protein F4W95_12075 [Chloroflexi bacterium]|nr:hypothetical protein [Chloroflexota bacterium]MYD49202.1 hypothetical protein [Chloroflexota bacterium]
MTTNNDSHNGSSGTGPNPEITTDDSDPTGRYRSSAAGQVQQNVADADGDVSPPGTEAPADAGPSTEAEAKPAPTERFQWMKDTRQWGVRAPLTQHGLTVESIAIGVYGEIPDESREMTRMPRGSVATPGMPRLDNYSVNRKDELWSDNAATLYEEAIQRRWNAMQDIDWDSLPEHPQDFELAWCQLCTELGQHATAEIDTIGQWLHRMNYAYIEPKMFLATQEFDSARHFEAMRHRALCNGGALGLESPGMMNRRMVETRAGWPEVAVSMYIARGTMTLLLYRFGAHFASNPVDRRIFSLCLQDKARHMAYGMGMLKLTVAVKGVDFGVSLRRILGSIEKDMAGELRDTVLWEAMAIISGGSVSGMAEGMAAVSRLRSDYVRQYAARLRCVGIDKQEPALHPDLAAVLQ